MLTFVCEWHGRGSAGKSTIFGAMGSVKDAIVGKLTMPSDIVKEKQQQQQEAALSVEETRPGAVAEALKAADQMHGQAFNDVGKMGDEDVVIVERKETRQGKM